jgi:hypothetical protein
MTLTPGNGYTIDVRQIDGLGSNWIVRTYRRTILRKKLLSSDWFLDGEQARRFAEQIACDVRDGHDIGSLQKRKPGWTLHRPAH